MNKERLYHEMPNDDYRRMLDVFFASNICIPKMDNRHPYADVLHKWLEGAEAEEFSSNEWRYFLSPYLLFNHEYRIKSVYEWRYALDNGHGVPIISDRYYTDEEYDKHADDKEHCVKLEWTKRERK